VVSLWGVVRAVFLLREVFEYSYREIAGIVGAGEAACRQMFHRATARVASRRPRSTISREEKRRLAERFVSAMRTGDGSALTSVLAADVDFWGDGGGKAIATGRPVLGRDNVLKLLLGIRRTAAAAGVPLDKITLELLDVNNEPAMIARVDGRLDSVYGFSIADDGIVAIRVIRNPEKLVFIDRQLRALSA
jgi:RNA polymerase sigma-70 factor (ECF subfamily)